MRALANHPAMLPARLLANLTLVPLSKAGSEAAADALDYLSTQPEVLLSHPPHFYHSRCLYTDTGKHTHTHAHTHTRTRARTHTLPIYVFTCS